MPGRVLSGPEVQPAEVPARVAPAGVPAGRVPATKVAASGVTASAPVLRLCGDEETDHSQQNRKDARRPHKEGSSSGHGPPTPGECGSSLLLFGWPECVTFSSQLGETLGHGRGSHSGAVEGCNQFYVTMRNGGKDSLSLQKVEIFDTVLEPS
jgi:hypothetical protein